MSSVPPPFSVQEAARPSLNSLANPILSAATSSGLGPSKDGLIRLLLQNSSPLPSAPSSPTASALLMGPPTTPLPKVPGASPIIQSLSMAPKIPPPPTSTQPSPILPPTSASISEATMSADLSPSPSPALQSDIAADCPSSNLLYQISEKEKCVGLIGIDHCYSRQYNWRSDVSYGFVKPTKTLFIPRVTRHLNSAPISWPLPDDVDTESVSQENCIFYDKDKALQAMTEVERYVTFANPDVDLLDSDDDWEAKIDKNSWILSQTRLFAKTVKVLHSDHLARIVHSEPIQRRLVVDKTAQRLRLIYASVLWETKTIQWLHKILVENLPRPYLIGYVDALQRLYQKVPSLVERMVAYKSPYDNNASSLCTEGLRLLLKRPWDPVAASLNQQQLKKLPANPIIIVTPSGPSDTWTTGSLRTRYWNTMFSQLAHTVVITMPHVEKSPGRSSYIIPLPKDPLRAVSPASFRSVNGSSQGGQPLSPGNLENAVPSVSGGNMTISGTDCCSAPEPATVLDMVAQLQKDNTKVGTYLHNMISNISSRIRDIKQAHPDRPIILVGWGVGAAINCQIAALESSVAPFSSSLCQSQGGITALVCLGFPLYTLDGIRGEPDDPILDLKTPVLFVVGENASQCRSDDLEDMRERMKAPNGLVLVGGADDQLRISKMKKRLEGVTQNMLDRCIMDEIRDFLRAVMTSPPPSFGIYQPNMSAANSHFHNGGAGDSFGNNGLGKKSGVKKSRKRNVAPGAASGRKPKAPKTDTSTLPSPLKGMDSAPDTPSSPSLSTASVGRKKKSGRADEVSKAKKMLDMNMPALSLASAPIGPNFIMNTNASPLPSANLLPVQGSSPLTPSFPSSSISLRPESATKSCTPVTSIHATSSALLTTASSVTSSALGTSLCQTTSLTRTAPPSVTESMSLVTNSSPYQSNNSGQIAIGISSPNMAPSFGTPNMPQFVNRSFTSGLPAMEDGSHARRPPSSVSHTSVQTSGIRPISMAPPVSGVKASTSPTAKDNVYIVTLPSNQLKQLESTGNSSSHMLAFVRDDDQTKFVPNQVSTSQLQGNSTDRRNVAEILASLSGLLPEPPSSSTTSKPLPMVTSNVSSSSSSSNSQATEWNCDTISGPQTSQPLVSQPNSSVSMLTNLEMKPSQPPIATGGTRVIRVLQAGRLSGPTSMPPQAPALPEGVGGSTAARSRKQTLCELKQAEEERRTGDNKNTEESGSKSESSYSPPTHTRLDASKASEQDILEEDLDDLEYTPYSKSRSKKTRAKKQ